MTDPRKKKHKVLYQMKLQEVLMTIPTIGHGCDGCRFWMRSCRWTQRKTAIAKWIKQITKRHGWKKDFFC